MGLEQLKVHEIVEQATGKQVDIPEFQREFVWGPEKVKLLAESLYREYPVGSFLLWDSAEYQETKSGQGTTASLWIVDGQQRTTALCLLLGMKPYWWKRADTWNKALDRYNVLVNVLPDDGAEYLEFALPNPIRKRDPRWIEIRGILSIKDVEKLADVAQSIAHKVNSEEMLNHFGKIHARIQRLWQIRNRDIPIIKISHEVEDVAEIFARLNREGTRVKEADVTLALAAVRNPGWVRDEYLPYCDALEERGWGLNAGIFIRTMTGIGHGRARLKEVPKDFWKPDNLPTVWKDAKQIISDVLKRLAAFGILSPDLLPSTNSLIPLFVLHYKWRSSHDYSFEKSLRWFLLANWDGRYSGSAITSLNEDVRAIRDAESFFSALDELHKRLRVPSVIDAEEFLKRYDRAGNRFLRLMLYLTLFSNNAPDWVDGTKIGFDKTGSPVTSGFSPQWHHIYPRSMLKSAGVDIDEIHALANITVLTERTNVNKLSGKRPARYIRQFSISPSALTAHFIPSSFSAANVDDKKLETQWSVSRYTDFLVERAQLLGRAATEFLQNLDVSR